MSRFGVLTEEHGGEGSRLGPRIWDLLDPGTLNDIKVPSSQCVTSVRYTANCQRCSRLTIGSPAMVEVFPGAISQTPYGVVYSTSNVLHSLTGWSGSLAAARAQCQVSGRQAGAVPAGKRLGTIWLSPSVAAERPRTAQGQDAVDDELITSNPATKRRGEGQACQPLK